MTTLFRAIEFLSLSLWLGGGCVPEFCGGSGAFAILGNRDAAGMMVGYSLGRLHFAGIFLGLVFLVARLARSHDFGSFTSAPALCVVLMVLLTAASQFTVSSRMGALKREMVSVAEHAGDGSAEGGVQPAASSVCCVRGGSAAPGPRWHVFPGP